VCIYVWMPSHTACADLSAVLPCAQDLDRSRKEPSAGLSAPAEQRANWYKTSRKYKSGNELRDYQVTCKILSCLHVCSSNIDSHHGTLNIDGTLSLVQVRGLNWIINNFIQGRNCILADEMGLGKTVQSISFLEHLMRVEHNRGPFLVVVPLSTINHWKREIEEWTDMNVLLYHDNGGKNAREIIKDYEFYFADPGNPTKDGKTLPPLTQYVTRRNVWCVGYALMKWWVFYRDRRKGRVVRFNTMVTTYETVIADVADLGVINWEFMVVDEGHRLKNKTAKLLEVSNDHC